MVMRSLLTEKAGLSGRGEAMGPTPEPFYKGPGRTGATPMCRVR